MFFEVTYIRKIVQNYYSALEGLPHEMVSNKPLQANRYVALMGMAK